MKKIGTVALLLLLSASLHAQCWQAVAGGIDHTIAIKPNGTLWAWGFNGGGQLGDGTTTEENVPGQIGTDSNWKIIAAGGNSSFAIKTDGSLWAWGDNFWGQLGVGSSGNKILTPVQIGTDNSWQSVSAGRTFTLAIKTDGSLWAWGNNLSGQLGNQAGAAFSPARVGVATDWKLVSAGGNHTIAIKTDGTLWTWGSNSSGELGDGTTAQKNTPQKIGVETNWQSISAGYNFSIAIKSSGTLWAWGSNNVSQLGDGTSVNKSSPTQVGTGTTWKSISTGYDNSVAIKTDGTLWEWGWIIGKFSLGTNSNSIPTQVGSDADWQSNSSGEEHSFAFKANGTLWGWGDGTWGKIGDGSWGDYFEPQSLSLPPTGDTFQQFCGSATVENLKANGTSIKWYSGISEGIPLSTNTILLDGNQYYASQVTNSCESTSRLSIIVSINKTSTSPPIGVPVQTLCSNDKVSSLVVAGKNIKWYLTSTGGVPTPNNTQVLNGNNYYASQTDNSCESTTRLAVLVNINTISPPTGLSIQDFCDGSEIKDIVVNGNGIKWFNSARGGIELAQNTKLMNDSTYYAASNIDFVESCARLAVKIRLSVSPTGEATQTFCNSADIARLAVIGSNVKWYDVPLGGKSLSSSTLLKSGNSYYASQTIGGCESVSRIKVTVQIKLIPTVVSPFKKEWEVAITALGTSFAIKADGTAWAWGENYYGQLGIGSNYTVINGKAQVGTSTNWKSISNGGFFRTIGLMTDGTLWAWGNNDLGQLGDGTRINKDSPVQIGADNDWQSISTDRHTSYAVKNDGSLWKWGESGEDKPTRWGNSSDWLSVSAAHYSFFAIKKDGTLWAWGDNSYGQLGNGTRDFYSVVPVQIGTDNNWKRIALGTYHTLAIKTDGTLWAWGFNARGELGDGTTTDRLSPVQIGTDTDWTSISAGEFFSLAIKENGTLWAWGVNNDFQHGDYTTNSKLIPTRISSDANWSSISSYEYQTVATKSDGTLWRWGKNYGTAILIGGSTLYIPYCDPVELPFCENTPVVANLSLLGPAIKWYDSPYGGVALSRSEILKNNSHYFAVQVIDECESQSRLCISTLVNAGVVPTPTGASSQFFCMSGYISDLKVTGQGIKWYSDEIGGASLPIISPLKNLNRYYASQTINGCESKYRLEVVASINETLPLAPIGEPNQNHCTNSTVASLVANGDAVKWYPSATGGTSLPTTTSLTNGTRYYASQTVNGCESQTRLEVLVTLSDSSPPTGLATQVFCSGATIADLAASGTNIQWYNSSTGGTALASTDLLTNGTSYYGSQTLNSCESVSRLNVLVTINSTAAPTASSTQSFCEGAVVNDLTATGNTIRWYTTSTGGNALASTTQLVNNSQYFTSQTIAGCESSTRTIITVLINPIPSAPSGASSQMLEKGKTIGDLVVNGSSIKWYASEDDAASKINDLPISTPVLNGASYYATQTVLACESSSFLKVTVAIVTAIEPIDPALEYYPNPVTNELAISLGREIGEVTVTNSVGQEVLFKMTNDHETLIDFSNLAQGIYLVRLQSKGELIQFKVVKM